MTDSVVMTFRTNPKLKKEASKLADTLGISLGAALNNYLRHFIQAKKITFAEDISDTNAEFYNHPGFADVNLSVEDFAKVLEAHRPKHGRVPKVS